MKRYIVNGVSPHPRRHGRGYGAKPAVILAALGVWLAWGAGASAVDGGSSWRNVATAHNPSEGVAVDIGATRLPARTVGAWRHGVTLPTGLARALRHGLGIPRVTSSQQITLAAPDGAQNDEFGYSVALSGNTALIGAVNKKHATGAVYVFVRSGTTWIQQAELTAKEGACCDWFGSQVALSGSTALVGATYPYSPTGAAYVFIHRGTTWTQQAKLTVADAGQGDWLGCSVALSGSTALIGAYGKNKHTGAAYIFVRSGTTWRQQAKLTAADSAQADEFGYSVVLNGNTALIGALGKNYGTGAAYVFVHIGMTWRQQAMLTAAGGSEYGGFGGSVALSGNTALIGAMNKRSGSGAVYVFVRSGTTWLRQAKLTASDGAPYDGFGFPVALSGNTALIGAEGKNKFTGAAYVFVRSGTTWRQRAKLTAKAGRPGDQFGEAVALSGSTALIGAASKDHLTGAAYLFWLGGTTWN